MVDFEKLSEAVDIDKDGRLDTYGIRYRHDVNAYNTLEYHIDAWHLYITIGEDQLPMGAAIVHPLIPYIKYNESVDFQKLVSDLDNHLCELSIFAKNKIQPNENSKDHLESAIEILKILEQIKAKSTIKIKKGLDYLYDNYSDLMQKLAD